MEELILGIGGNQGDRLKTMAETRLLISQRMGTIMIQSGIVESPPWGYQSTQAFLNQVLVVNTELSAQQLLEAIAWIDQYFGRMRHDFYTDRMADVDILFYGKAIIREEGLIIPHEKLHLRRFVLAPLAGIRPELVHPVLNRTMLELLDHCPDQSEIKWITSKN